MAARMARTEAARPPPGALAALFASMGLDQPLVLPSLAGAAAGTAPAGAQLKQPPTQSRRSPKRKVAAREEGAAQAQDGGAAAERPRRTKKELAQELPEQVKRGASKRKKPEPPASAAVGGSLWAGAADASVPPTKKFREECKYWPLGACIKGDACPFRHVGLPQRKDDVCKFFMTGSCLKGDACLFSHDLKKVPCRFHHLFGGCAKGEQCPYSHAKLTLLELEQFSKEEAARTAGSTDVAKPPDTRPTRRRAATASRAPAAGLVPSERVAAETAAASLAPSAASSSPGAPAGFGSLFASNGDAVSTPAPPEAAAIPTVPVPVAAADSTGVSDGSRASDASRLLDSLSIDVFGGS